MSETSEAAMMPDVIPEEEAFIDDEQAAAATTTTTTTTSSRPTTSPQKARLHRTNTDNSSVFSGVPDQSSSSQPNSRPTSRARSSMSRQSRRRSSLLHGLSGGGSFHFRLSSEKLGHVLNESLINYDKLAHEAVKRGDCDYLEYLLSKYPHLVDVKWFGESLAVTALKCGHRAIFELLLDNGLDHRKVAVSLCDFNNKTQRLECYDRSLYEFACDFPNRQEFVSLLDEIEGKLYYFQTPTKHRKPRKVDESLLLYVNRRDKVTQEPLKDPEEEQSMNLGILLYGEENLLAEPQTVSSKVSVQDVPEPGTSPMRAQAPSFASSVAPSSIVAPSSQASFAERKRQKRSLEAQQRRERQLEEDRRKNAWLALEPSSPRTRHRMLRACESLQVIEHDYREKGVVGVGATNRNMAKICLWRSPYKNKMPPSKVEDDETLVHALREGYFEYYNEEVKPNLPPIKKMISADNRPPVLQVTEHLSSSSSQEAVVPPAAKFPKPKSILGRTWSTPQQPKSSSKPYYHIRFNTDGDENEEELLRNKPSTADASVPLHHVHAYRSSTSFPVVRVPSASQCPRSARKTPSPDLVCSRSNSPALGHHHRHLASMTDCCQNDADQTYFNAYYQALVSAVTRSDTPILRDSCMQQQQQQQQPTPPQSSQSARASFFITRGQSPAPMAVSSIFRTSLQRSSSSGPKSK